MTMRHESQALETIRFGEYLREKRLLTEEQLIEALAAHWSDRRGRIGRTIADRGFLSPEEVERHARLYHGLDVIEIDG
jgi:hypothetical protein